MLRSKRGLTGEQRTELWERWKKGQSLSDIGRALGKAPGSVFGFVAARGGIPPACRKRSERALTTNERETISRGLSAGSSLRAIAGQLGRPPSTVSREVKRNGGRGSYRAAEAESRAWTSTIRPKTCKLADHRRLQQLVALKLRDDWSPEQISGWLKRTFPDDECMNISHETIYRSLFIQARGVLKKELQAHLRSRRKMRRAKSATTAGQTRGQIVDAVPISARPPEIEDRAVPGHWEGDLISGSGNSHIATLVERQSRFTMLVKVTGKDTETVVAAMIRQVKKIPIELRRSLTGIAEPRWLHTKRSASRPM